MLPDALICQISPGRHFLDWSQKCCKLFSGNFLGSLSGLVPEILQNNSLEAPWAQFPGWGQKCFKTILWRLPVLAFRAGARNSSKQFSGGILGSLSGLGPEMLQNNSLKASWAHSPGTLYVLYRSRAFHEVWCPKVIGRDSWVREATGISVQGIPPKNWGKKLAVVRKRIAR